MSHKVGAPPLSLSVTNPMCAVTMGGRRCCQGKLFTHHTTKDPQTNLREAVGIIVQSGDKTVCSRAVKAVFHCSATLGVYPHACKSSVGTTATCILILKKVRLCANVHWCVCASLRVFCLRKQPSDSNRESQRKNAILFDVLKSSLILSCLFESSSQRYGQRGKISRA